ncbi:hypothetical protein PUR59_04290 [Streptomyces sp. SP18ES09]|uniref:hypothetical protein n=1 Tax=Streptomyces sp. SP18ES09 TaxID=3002532 RepID=UPI002E75D304|nr:hypothetical protein [Streptomyces sp. SP18ES09]MEE1814240.1 hypothetical protein [Streptomyces sp. SP18ES09]
MTFLLPAVVVALVVLAAAVLLGHPAARHHTRGQRWRHWAHRTGVLRSFVCERPFGSLRQRAQLRAGLPVLRPSVRNRARIVASHARRGLHAECPTHRAEGHTYRRPCALAPTRSSR